MFPVAVVGREPPHTVLLINSQHVSPSGRARPRLGVHANNAAALTEVRYVLLRSTGCNESAWLPGLKWRRQAEGKPSVFQGEVLLVQHVGPDSSRQTDHAREGDGQIIVPSVCKGCTGGRRCRRDVTAWLRIIIPDVELNVGLGACTMWLGASVKARHLFCPSGSTLFF